MYIDLLDPLSLCQLQKSVDVGIVAVHATVGHKSHKMKGRAVFLYIFAGCKEGFVLKEVAVLDSLCDLCQILVYNAAGSHVQMSYL